MIGLGYIFQIMDCPGSKSKTPIIITFPKGILGHFKEVIGSFGGVSGFQ
jgi:hypothetical protein